MMMLDLKDPERRGRSRRRGSPRVPERWAPIPSRDDDMMPVPSSPHPSDIGTSVALGSLGVLIALGIVVALATSPARGMRTIDAIPAYLLVITLTGWLPAMLIGIAARPLIEARQRARANLVLTGVSVAPDPGLKLGALGVPRRTSFFDAHRRGLAGCGVASGGSIAWLVSLAVQGLTIEGAVVGGVLGTFSTLFLVILLVTALLGSIALPVFWYRRHRRMQQLTVDADELELVAE